MLYGYIGELVLGEDYPGIILGGGGSEETSGAGCGLGTFGEFCHGENWRDYVEPGTIVLDVSLISNPLEFNSSTLVLLLEQLGASPHTLRFTTTHRTADSYLPWITRIFNGLSLAVNGIQGNRGYNNSVNSANVFVGYASAFDKATQPKDFLKILILADSFKTKLMPSNEWTHECEFFVIAVTRKAHATDTAYLTQIDEFSDDLEEALQRNPTLNNSVAFAQVKGYFFDQGYSEPESIGIFRIVAEHHSLN